MFYSLRTRIGLLYTLLILLVMAGIAIYGTNFIERSYLADLEGRLESEARLAGQIVLPIMLSVDDPDQIDAVVKKISDGTGARMTIIAADGVVLGESDEDKDTMENHANRPEIVQARLTGRGSERRTSATLGYDMFYVAVRIENGSQLLGYSRMGVSLQLLEEKIKQLQRTLLGVTILLTLITSLLAIWISNRTTFTLTELSQAAGQIAKGDLSTRLIPSSKDEIGALTQTFNAMAIQLEERLQELEAERSRVSAVLGTMSDGVMIIDAENRILLCNPAAQSIFLIGTDQALNRSVFEYVHHHQIEKIILECRQSGEAHTLMLDYPGRRLTVLATATPLGAGQQGNILLLFQDLTELHRLETVRKDFITNISHELRTPLASLKALTETLNDSALDDPPAGRKFLKRMEVELDALTQTVNEILELSRIESGSVPLRLTSTSVCDLIKETVERFSTQTERAKLVVEIDCPADLPRAQADPDRLAQVLVNLIHNAIKFTPAGGKIIIGSREQDGMLRCFVSDTGVGIPEADLTRIFERFYKADQARSSGGTGLGLAIARHLVEAHQGKIWAEGIEGQGSTFIFTIPIADYSKT